MTRVQIGLEHKNTLRWFNQLHAALLKRERLEQSKSINDDERKLLQEHANNELIAGIQSVIKEIQQENARLKK